MLQIMRLVELIFYIAASMAVSRATPESQREKQISTKEHSSQEIESNSATEQDIPDAYKSIYVRFSATTPDDIPSNFPKSEHLSRRKRSAGNTRHIKQQVCDTISRWVTKSTAQTMWGSTVNVARTMDISGTRVNQYFYETSCQTENCECRGIDTRHYNSKCESKFIWAYAKVSDRFGTEGWNLIKLGASCACSITQKAEEIYQSIWDDL